MTFYFYDLETSGFNPRDARIMQFAGQRTDESLNPIGEPHNVLLRLTDEIVPEPDAILVTGITPQQTLADGITEVEFLKLFHDEIAIPDTVMLGFNTVRFDDEFMRYMHYRNFYDAYEWQYTSGKSKWDLLDVVRMTRALRPDGIKWPVDENGKATNRLELITKLNGIEHENAHDALADVTASIAVARLIKEKQPKLFDYLFTMREKRAAAQLVTQGQPFLYTSGQYDSEYEKTTAVAMLAEHPQRPGALVFDLRHDPEQFAGMTPEALAEAWRRRKDEPGLRLPVKTLQYNKCPAVAPLAVLDAGSQERLHLKMDDIATNYAKLRKSKLAPLVLQALEILEKANRARFANADEDVDGKLYDGFVGEGDKTKMSVVRAARPTEIAGLDLVFQDRRLQELFPRYKARNFPYALQDEERIAWEKFREERLLGGGQTSRLAKFFDRLAALAQTEGLTPEKQYLLEELQLYGQSIMPASFE